MRALFTALVIIFSIGAAFAADIREHLA